MSVGKILICCKYNIEPQKNFKSPEDELEFGIEDAYGHLDTGLQMVLLVQMDGWHLREIFSQSLYHEG